MTQRVYSNLETTIIAIIRVCLASVCTAVFFLSAWTAAKAAPKTSGKPAPSTKRKGRESRVGDGHNPSCPIGAGARPGECSVDLAFSDAAVQRVAVISKVEPETNYAEQPRVAVISRVEPETNYAEPRVAVISKVEPETNYAWYPHMAVISKVEVEPETNYA